MVCGFVNLSHADKAAPLLNWHADFTPGIENCDLDTQPDMPQVMYSKLKACRGSQKSFKRTPVHLADVSKNHGGSRPSKWSFTIGLFIFLQQIPNTHLDRYIRNAAAIRDTWATSYFASPWTCRLQMSPASNMLMWLGTQTGWFPAWPIHFKRSGWKT